MSDETPASPEGPRQPCPSGACDHYADAHADIGRGLCLVRGCPCPRSPEGPDEGLRDVIAAAIYADAEGVDPEERSEVTTDVEAAVRAYYAPLLTAERGRPGQPGKSEGDDAGLAGRRTVRSPSPPLLALYDDLRRPEHPDGPDDLDDFMADQRGDEEFVVAYIRAHIEALHEDRADLFRRIPGSQGVGERAADIYDEARERADRLAQVAARVEALCAEGPGSPLDPTHGHVSLRRLRAALSATDPGSSE